jgi:NhaP-type Na+/H+ or K+/H+ antiporter
MKNSAKRTALYAAFLISCILALVDLLFFRGLFSWMFLVPLVFITGAANVAVALWKRQGRIALLCLVVMVFLCGAYAGLLAWSLN